MTSWIKIETWDTGTTVTCFHDKKKHFLELEQANTCLDKCE